MEDNVEQQNDVSMKIAVIGMAGRFPGANNVNEFWHNLCDGKETISHLTSKELCDAGVNQDIQGDDNYVKSRGVLNDIEYFDSQFFDYSAREASMIDPQHRIFLECSWKAFEAANTIPDKYSGRIGVFAGCSESSYAKNVINKDNQNNYDEVQLNISNGVSFLATRVAYKLGLTGPCLNINTACSTSLVCVATACKYLLDYECDVALAGGVTIAIPQKKGYLYQPNGILSSDGHCRAFDINSTGLVPSNAVGAVVLKRLEDAIEDGDCIDAVICGYSVNNDGNQKIGFTAPGVVGQAKCISTALSFAELNPEDINYIEAHGTGTSLGDTVEIEALKEVFSGVENDHSCAIGSVKTNIGHADSAAGIVGLIKSILIVKNGVIPPTIHFSKANPKHGLEKSPFYVNNELENHQSKKTFRAGISSFGIGGTNAHVIVENHLRTNEITDSNHCDNHLLCFSAKTQESLLKNLKNFMLYLQSTKDDLSDISYSLNVGRKDFDCRLIIAEKNKQKLLDVIKNKVDNPGDNKEKCEEVALFFGDINPSFSRKLLASMLTCHYLDEPIRECFLLIFESYEKYNFGNIKCIEDLILNVQQELILFVLEYSFAKSILSLGINVASYFGSGCGEYVALAISKTIPLYCIIELMVLSVNDKKNMDMLSVYDSIFDKIRASQNELKADNIYLSSHDYSCPIKEILTPQYWSSAKKSKADVNIRDLIKQLVISFSQNETETKLSIDVLSKFKQKNSCINALLDVLGECWECGLNINWCSFYKGCSKNKKVLLPTHEYDREYLWASNNQLMSYDHSVSEYVMPFDKWYYEPVWKLSNVVNKPVKNSDGYFLIFHDELGVGKEISITFRSKQIKVIDVFIGKEFENKFSEEKKFKIKQTSSSDINDIFQYLKDKQEKISGIVYLWPILYENGDLELIENHHEALKQSCFYSYVNVVQALLKYHGNNNDFMRILMISNRTHDILQKDNINPYKLISLGPSLVIPQEHQNVSVSMIDCDVDLDNASDYASYIFNEMFCLSDAVIAYRNHNRYVKTYNRLSYKKHLLETSAIKNNGIYLITGGLGRIGLLIAQKIAEIASNVTIILLSRRKFPVESYWDNVSSLSDEEEKIINAVRLMENRGAKICIESCDVSDYAQMKKCVNDYESKLGLINGIVYAAGDIKKNTHVLIDNLNIDDAEQQFKSKIDGTVNLYNVFKDKLIDFVYLFSSMSPLIGGIGFTAYSAANAFLDGFSFYVNKRYSKDVWKTINWDGWEFDGRVDSKYILPIEGQNVFDAILRFDTDVHYNNLVISKTDLFDRLDHLVDINKPNNKYTLFQKPQCNKRHDICGESPEEIIKKLFKECLGGIIDDYGPDTDFFKVGGTSLIAIQLSAQLSEIFKAKLNIIDIYECKTISRLIKRILDKQPIKNEPPLVTLSKEGSLSPLFLIHPVGGTLASYNDLVQKLNINRPIIGIYDIEIDQQEVEYASLEEIASVYLKLIRKVQPKGTYYLGGASFGSVVAYEIANQLIQHGNNVGQVISFDGWLPSSKFLYDRHNIMSSIYKYMQVYIEKAGHIYDSKAKHIWLKRLKDRMLLQAKYKPTKTNIPVMLFKALEIMPEYAKVNHAKNYWDDYVGNLKTYEIVGDHDSIMEKENVKHIATILNTFFEKNCKS